MITEHTKRMNRSRCMTLFAYLRGNYNELCEAHETTKKGGSAVYVYPNKARDFDSRAIPEIESLCGDWFKNGVNPDCLPHPIRIAIDLKNGKNIDAPLALLNKHHYKQRVIDRCYELGISLQK